MAKQQKRVALIGSSGGGTATLGHTNVSDFVRLVADHLHSIGGPPSSSVLLDTVLFVSLDNGSGFDSVTGEEEATLLFIQDGGSKEVSFHDTLDRINEKVRNFEESIAARVEKKSLHGLISVSCKPSLFSRTLRAAARQRVPVTGTGGSSLAMATSEFKIRLIGNSGGSVGTTPETKAISFASAFSKDWSMDYNPWTSKATRPDPPSWRSVLNACLPGFWSVALLKKILLGTSADTWLSKDDRNTLLSMIESHALPILCAVIMATSRRKVESVQMSAVLAGVACRRTILGGMISGWAVSSLEEQLLYTSILKWKIPASFTNLITGGFVGIFVAAFMTPVSPYLSIATEQFRKTTMTYLWEPRESNEQEFIRLLASSVLGFLFCYGSKVGWCEFFGPEIFCHFLFTTFKANQRWIADLNFLLHFFLLDHSIFLPVILVEMELGDPSMLGTLDLLTLVLVCSGVCLGLFFTGSKENRSLAKRGITINLLFGDFIEACYPHMEQHSVVNISGYLASSLSAVILTGSCRSSAYLPFPIAIWLAEDRKALLIASAFAFFVPFIGTVTNHFFFDRKNKSD